MMPHQQPVVSAVVTDPDGIDDLIGGVLETPEGNANYGAFASSAAEGAYQMTLTWSQLHDVASIDGDASGVARTPVSGASVVCREGAPGCLGSYMYCGDSCVDPGDEETCGSCDHDCTAIAASSPLQGGNHWCQAAEQCVETGYFFLQQRITCNEACEALGAGFTCEPTANSGAFYAQGGQEDFVRTGCDTVPAPSHGWPFDRLRCHCESVD